MLILKLTEILYGRADFCDAVMLKIQGYTERGDELSLHLHSFFMGPTIINQCL